MAVPLSASKNQQGIDFDRFKNEVMRKCPVCSQMFPKASLPSHLMEHAEESDEENLPPINLAPSKTPTSAAKTSASGPILKDVVAYVEMGPASSEASQACGGALEKLGAKVVKSFTMDVTHVIFSQGKCKTYDKAMARGLYLVSILWVEGCRKEGRRVDERDYPAKPDYKIPTPRGKKTASAKSTSDKTRATPKSTPRGPTAKKVPGSSKLSTAEPGTASKVQPPTDEVEEMQVDVAEGARAKRSVKKDKEKKQLYFSSDESDGDDKGFMSDVSEELHPTAPPPKPKPAAKLPPKAAASKISKKSAGGVKRKAMRVSDSEEEEEERGREREKEMGGTASKRRRVHESPEMERDKDPVFDFGDSSPSQSPVLGKKLIKKSAMVEPEPAKEPERPSAPASKLSKKGPKASGKATTKAKTGNENTEKSAEAESDKEEKAAGAKGSKKGAKSNTREVEEEVKEREGEGDVEMGVETGTKRDDSPSTATKQAVSAKKTKATPKATPKSTPAHSAAKSAKVKSPPKPFRGVIVTTNLHTEERDIVHQSIEHLGGYRREEKVTEHTTHVVCGDQRRTLNVLGAIAHGCWLVSKDWVLSSLSSNNWVSEEPFELFEWFPAARLERLNRLISQGETSDPYENTLFQGVVFHIGDSAPTDKNKTPPPRDVLVSLITACGGKVTTQIKAATVCVNPPAGLVTDLPCVSERWILDSVEQRQALDYDSYKVMLSDGPMPDSPEF
eukprot:comp22601_c2_seq1/m.34661 comp22601_c2_seq1/g.34661  ORF comp22601_c2_seq1/g.34661 comp22601_c2_seq1/m.34661 type:complete len:731 (-) comp22601_c2_seq1:124-2316(-)